MCSGNRLEVVLCRLDFNDDYGVKTLLTWGFQSESHMMTLEAFVRLIPKGLLDEYKWMRAMVLTETSRFGGYQKDFVCYDIGK